MTDTKTPKRIAEARPKVSIVTVCHNSAGTIADTVRSVSGQRYPSIEHIIIDGGSNDGTLEVLSPFRDRIAVLVSEPDGGMYDAMNKGICLASGSIVGILSARSSKASGAFGSPTRRA
ncbi:MAG: glycosyltransferase [Gammaproteobacteria bacterium]